MFVYNACFFLLLLAPFSSLLVVWCVVCVRAVRLLLKSDTLLSVLAVFPCGGE